MSNENKVLIGIGIATLVIVVAATLLVGGKPSSTAQQNAEPITNAEALIRSDSHKEGAKEGKVTLVEFGDFQCPACGAAHPTVKQLLAEYEGKVTFVFRNFPLPMHKNAEIAAQAAEAAGEQGKFFEMHDMLFTNQGEWENSNKPLDVFMTYAKELKLDEEKFKEAVESGKFKKKVESDVKDGYAVGVNSTPTFFINGVKQEAGIQYQAFKEQIDAKLKEK